MAFGLRPGSTPDRFLVGLAILGLLSEMAADQPLLCLVDDAQWLGQASAQALAFAARRLDAESVAFLFSTRDPAAECGLAGLPGMAVEGLTDADARALLASVIPGPLDERIRDRIIADSGGNPLALLELPHGVTKADLAGGFGLPAAGPLPLAGRIEQSFLRRITRFLSWPSASCCWPRPICTRSSPSSASAHAASLFPRFPHDKAQHRRSPHRADSRAEPRTAAAVPAWPAIRRYPPSGHD